jgi:hypothetical protein
MTPSFTLLFLCLNLLLCNVVMNFLILSAWTGTHIFFTNKIAINVKT